jgi:epoxide hydrolase-like predicted phosphatase
MIKNIIFDIGNVLSYFCWQDFLRNKGFDEDMVERIGRASVYDEDWYEFDKGVLKDEEVIDLFIENDPEIAEEIHQAFDYVEGMVKLKPQTMDWLNGLKSRGYKLYYLSNFSYKCETQCPDSLSFMPMMDGGILSYKVQMTKPNPDIYKKLLSMYSLKAEESVFIDDTPKNIDAAVKLGIKGIVYKDPDQAAEELEKLLLS